MYTVYIVNTYGKSAPRDEIVMRSFGKPNQQWKIASSLWFRLPEVITNSRRRRSVAISILAQSWYVLTIWLCCRAVRSLLEAGDQFVQRAAGLHMDHVVSSLLLKLTCLLGIVMLVPEVERISTQIWNTQFVKIPLIIACSEQSSFRAPNLETNPETCFLQQGHFHPFPTFKSSKSSGHGPWLQVVNQHPHRTPPDLIQ